MNHPKKGMYYISLEIKKNIAESLVSDAGAIVVQLQYADECEIYISRKISYDINAELTIKRLEFLKGMNIIIVNSYSNGFDFFIDSRDE